ncbi:hypothetical protein L6R52_39980 [Myxococcota bacterium]|nr:hypothetical protein [Myxococcota bacterium]
MATRLFSTLALLSLTACASTGPAAKVDLGVSASEYAPLGVGSAWTYQVSYPGQSGEMTVTLVGEKDGYFVDDRDGSFRHTPEGLRDRQRYLLRHPITAGATWKTIVSASAVEKNVILSVGERCETLAGSFPDCVVVESSVRRDDQVTLIIRWTWARGIGLVKLETEADIAGRGRVPQVKQSLVRYALKAQGESKTGGAPADGQGNPTEDGAPGGWEK